MARKYDLISEVYNRTCKTVTANPASWHHRLVLFILRTQLGSARGQFVFAHIGYHCHVNPVLSPY